MEQSAERVYTLPAAVGNLPIRCFVAARTFFCPEPPELAFSEEHVHACFELLLCRKGSGFQFINGLGHAYGENTVFLMSPFLSHAHISSDAQEIRASVRFILPQGQELSGCCDKSLEAGLKYLRQQGFHQFTAKPPLATLIQLIAQAAERQDCGTLALGGLLSACFSFVFEDLCAHARQGIQTSRKALLPAENGLEIAPGEFPPLDDAQALSGDDARRLLIDAYFDSLVDGRARIKDLCDAVHLSASQLNRVIRELYGTTFKQRIIDVRLAYIQYYLKYSGLPMNQIAQRTGFSEGRQLSVFFREHTGLTPTQYRRQQGGAEPIEAAGPDEK